jgi:hypothetical protein
MVKLQNITDTNGYITYVDANFDSAPGPDILESPLFTQAPAGSDRQYFIVWIDAVHTQNREISSITPPTTDTGRAFTAGLFK